MALRILFTIIISLSCIISQTPYTIKTIKNTGVFFEKTLTTWTYSETSTILTTISVPDFSTHTHMLETYNYKLQEICQQIAVNNENHICKSITRKIDEEIKTLNHNGFTIQHTHYLRRKRGLIDGVGNIAKFLFGTMDNDDANQIFKELDEVSKTHTETTKILNEQTTIMSSNFNILSKSTEQINEDISILEAKTNNLTIELRNINKAATSTMNTLILNEKFMEIAELTLISCLTINQEQQKFLNILSHLQLKKLHPLILSYKNIQKSIETSQKERNKINAKILSQIADINYIIIEDKIIIKISIPIPNTTPQYLYKIYLTPIKNTTNNKYYTWNIEDNYIISNENEEKLFTLSTNELQLCKRIEADIDKQILLCENINPIYSTNSNKCIVNLFVNLFNTKPNCELKQIPMTNKFIKLSKANTWLFTINENVNIALQCQSKITKLTLNGTGIISFNNTCILNTEEYSIPISNTNYNEINTLQDDDFKEPAIIKDSITFSDYNTKHTQIKNIIMSSHISHNEEILEEQEKLHNLKQKTELNEQIAQHKINSVKSRYTYASLIFLLFIINSIILTIYICRRIKLKRDNQNPNVLSREITNHLTTNNISAVNQHPIISKKSINHPTPKEEEEIQELLPIKEAMKEDQNQTILKRTKSIRPRFQPL